MSHHFAFRGADDVTYIVSAYLARSLPSHWASNLYPAKHAEHPRMTWGVQDLAKSRAMLTLLRELEGPTFA